VANPRPIKLPRFVLNNKKYDGHKTAKSARLALGGFLYRVFPVQPVFLGLTLEFFCRLFSIFWGIAEKTVI
jgi:hypothetical protein